MCRDQESEQYEESTTAVEINKSKTDSSDVDTSGEMEVSVNNDDRTEQSENVDVVIKATHQVETKAENLSTKPTKSKLGEEDSKVQTKTKNMKQTLKGQGTKFQKVEHDGAKTVPRDIKATTGAFHAKTFLPIKPSKSCEMLAKHFTKTSERYRAKQRPTFYRSRDDIDISVHIYETVSDIQARKNAQVFNSHTNVAKFPTQKGPHLSKEILRVGYKHREPPPDPKRAQSKESIESDVQINPSMSILSGTSHKNEPAMKSNSSMMCTSTEETIVDDHTPPTLSANEQMSAASGGDMANRKFHRQYKHRPPRPPPPKIRLQGLQPNLHSRGQNSIQMCTASSSDSSSTSEDVLSFLRSKGVGTGIGIPTKIGLQAAAVGMTQDGSQYGSDAFYQPLSAERKEPLALYESLNKSSDNNIIEPKGISGDKAGEVGCINAQEPILSPRETQSTKRQPQCQDIRRKVADDSPDSDSEDDYMPLVPTRKKNTVVSEYASLHFVHQNQ